MTSEQLIETIDRTISEKEAENSDSFSFMKEYQKAYQKDVLIDAKILKHLKKLPSIDCLEIPAKPTFRTLTNREFSKLGLEDEENTSAFLQVSEEVCSQWIDENLKNIGLTILDSSEMDKIPQKIIEKYINAISNSNIDRITSSAGILARHAFLIYLPESVILKKPISIHINPTGKTNYFPLLLWLYVGKGSSVNLSIKSSYKGTDSSSYLLPVEVRAIVEEDGSAELFEIQDLNENGVSFPYHEYHLAERARLESFLCENGTTFSRRTMIVNLEGTQSEANLTGIYKPTGSQKLIFDTVQNHMASFTKSDLEFKGVLDGESETIWKGNIYVEKGTRGVDGYQRNENILMEASAYAESIPGLEIIADDVRCSHGVTLSSIDKDQLFYMKSRGIQKEDAIDLISYGFLQSATIRIHNDHFKKMAEDCLNIKNK